ncbi:recombination regulator RecX [Streptomyces tricolor]|nr:recombination regulator RecX [Streptomyces tricolor]
MTRPTDRAEYEYATPGAPRGGGTGGYPDPSRTVPTNTGATGTTGTTGRDEHRERDEHGGLDPYRGTGGHGGDGDAGGEPYGGGSPGGRASRGPGVARGGGQGRGRRRRGFGDAPGEDEGAPPSARDERGSLQGTRLSGPGRSACACSPGTPRTRKQLADALRKREIPEDVADEVLDRFEEVGLIDDGAFADAWVESRHHGRGLARRALARELRTKGVDSALIEDAVAQLDPEQEEATARELVARKLRATRGLDRDKRLRRLAGMLARKGYSEGMALRVVRQALEEEGEDTEFLGDGDF